MDTLSIEIPLSAPAVTAIRALERAGHEAWCVGGCVRDSLLERTVNDFDIATSAHWEQAERILEAAGFAVHRTGVKHGTVTATLDGQALEITTFRTEGGYSDGRHPDTVSYVTSIEEDLARRDFTVNAMAFNPDRGILDCWGGLQDLRLETIRAVGKPAKRFREDGLRILRGCRFASQLGFSIEPDTLQAMRSTKMMLTRVSAERVTHELDALLLGDHVHDALMDAIDVIGAVIPEIVACKEFEQHTPYHIYDVWEHIAWVVQRSPATRLNRWAALFHDIGKPAAFFRDGDRGHFYGHARLSELMAREIMKRLLMAPSFIEKVATLVRIHDEQIEPAPRSVRRALVKLGGDVDLFESLIGLKRADALAQSALGKPRVEIAGELERVLADVLEAGQAFAIGQLAIDGHDVMSLGIPAGPAVGAALANALDAVVNETISNDRDALLTFLSTSQTAGKIGDTGTILG